MCLGLASLNFNLYLQINFLFLIQDYDDLLELKDDDNEDVEEDFEEDFEEEYDTDDEGSINNANDSHQLQLNDIEQFGFENNEYVTKSSRLQSYVDSTDEEEDYDTDDEGSIMSIAQTETTILSDDDFFG